MRVFKAKDYLYGKNVRVKKYEICLFTYLISTPDGFVGYKAGQG